MRGAAPTVADLNLELNDVLLPANLLSEEVLQSSDDEYEITEEESVVPFRIDTCCYRCEVAVRITLYAAELGLRTLEQLLVEGKLTFCCTACARSLNRNGR